MSWNEKTQAAFRVALLLQSVDFATHLRKRLSHFSTYLLPDEDVLLSRAQSDPPHLVLINVATLGRPVEMLLAELEELNSEIEVILIGSPQECAPAEEFFLNGVVGLHPREELENLVLTVESHLRSLFLRYQNEQLFLDLSLQKQKLQVGLQKIKDLEERPLEVLGFHVQEEARLFQTAETREELFHRFFERAKDITGANNLCGLFFRSLRLQNTLLPVHPFGVADEKLKGFGVPLSAPSQANQVDSLRGFLKDVLRVQEFASFPMRTFSDFEGHLVVWNHDKKSLPLIENLHQVFQLVWDQKAGMKSKTQQQVVDPKSGFFHWSQLKAKMQIEWARAQRLQSPLCYLHCRIDHLDLLRLNVDSQAALLEKIYESVRKGSRPYDLSFIRGLDEFVLLLPHTSLNGAKSRSDRLRLQVEKLGHSLVSEKLTLSLAIVDYPRAAQTQQEIVELGEKLLRKALAAGGNRTEFAVAHPKPDFVAPSL